MRYQNVAFALFRTVGGREVTACANHVIFFSLSECLISLLSRGLVRDTIYTNRTPMVLGRDFHVPQQKGWIGSLLREIPRWKPVSMEDITQVADGLRVEHMELLLNDEFKNDRRVARTSRTGNRETHPGAREKHWTRIIQSLGTYEKHIQSFYPTRRELAIDEAR